MKKSAIILACMLLAGSMTLSLAGCGQNAGSAASGSSVSAADSEDPQAQEAHTTDIFAMDTAMTLTAYGSHGQEALDAAEEEIERLDSLFSISSETGDIYSLNQNGTAQLSEDAVYVLGRALDISASTGGLFDPTVYNLMAAWGFTDDKFRIPDADEIAELLTHVGYSKITLDGSTASVPEDVKVDLGGIVKGFTSDRIMDLMAEKGVKSAVISLGGNVETLGIKPDGSNWKVGIQDPHDTSAIAGILESSDEAVITSGNYERFFEKNGKKYHHILDPRTGCPAESGLLSVTIVSQDGTLADGLSTALYVMGLEDASDYWRENGSSQGFGVIIITDEDEIWVSEDLADRFEAKKGYEMHVIEKE